MNEIGGYFSIEHSNIECGIHPNAIKLNTGRNCFEYILLGKEYSKVYLPYYTCDAVLEPLLKMGVEYDFYLIDHNFELISVPALKKDEALVYTNYFGLKGRYICQLSTTINNIIVDNSQALFEEPVKGLDTFYSLRKFVGMPDGAFVYTHKSLEKEFETAASFSRVSHLYKRKDSTATEGYDDFKKSEEALCGLPIMLMSPSTQSFIYGYDFKKNKVLRERNFVFLHSLIGRFNQINIPLSDINGPLCYPFLGHDAALKDELIRNKVFVPTFWPNVLDWLPNIHCWERTCVNELVCLPIDHRYNLDDLLSISKIISKS